LKLTTNVVEALCPNKVMNHVLIFSYPSFPTSHTSRTSTDKGIVCGWVLVSLVGYLMNVNNVFNVFNVQIMADNHSSVISASHYGTLE
jgi:hypothetical protein